MESNAKFHFEEEIALAFVLEWQKTKCERAFEGFLKTTDGMIKALVFSRGIHQYMEIAEIISLVQIKIWKGLHLYNPSRGRLYSFLVRVIHNRITQAQIDTRKQVHHEPLEDDEWDGVATHEDYDHAGTEDLSHKIMKVKTICTDQMELEAQRWLVTSFISSSFDVRRHVASNAMTRVYGITKARSRQLHDYTLLEVRRAILDGNVVPEASTFSLCGTRQKALKKYAKSLTKKDFSKLVFLMRNLSSTLIVDVRHVLDGFPDSVPLFDGFPK
jgi:DNA-directed RNA polymerase specialized sigma24 family protein